MKVNGEYITACNHDDAVNILRNAGDIVVLTVKHYRAATPFLQVLSNLRKSFDFHKFQKKLFQKQLSRDTPESSDNDATCTELKADDTWRLVTNNNNNNIINNNTSTLNSTLNNNNNNRQSLCSDTEIRWVDIVSVPLMMAYGESLLHDNPFL